MNWIPVSERLPSDLGNVMITVRENQSGMHYVVPCCWSYACDLETGEITGGPSFVELINENGQDIFVDYLKNQSVKVLAWMPYPKPYEDCFRVIVAGSRTFSDYGFLSEKLNKVFEKHKPTSIVCGEARGADTLGRKYAEEHGIQVDSFPADWNRFGKQAGYIRNEEMACEADALVAFQVNNSLGTQHMIDTARKHGLQVRVYKV